MTDIEDMNKEPDFSLVLGGPLYQLWLRAGLIDSRMELLTRRIIVISLITWLPLLILSFIEGRATAGSVTVPFTYDILNHVRFLVVLPVLIAAELFVHLRMGPAIQQFINRDIVSGDDVRKFEEAKEGAFRLRNSWALEIGLIVFVYTVGVWVWRSRIAIESPSWYANPDGTSMNLTLAGYWIVFVSIPILQFVLLRWYARFLIWARFLWKVSRLHLNLVATHPDRMGGLGFLSRATYAYGLILFAQGALLAGFISNEIFLKGRELLDFKFQAATSIVFFVTAVLSPLLVFSPVLLRTKRGGLGQYGTFASEYVRDFEKKWIDGVNPEGEELLGTGDIQSLTDLGNSFVVVGKMKPVPFGIKDIIRLAVITAAPLIPLGLFVLSPAELLGKLLRIVF